MTADARYEILVRKAGLYGQAFFGWVSTPEEDAKLDRLWKQAMAEAKKDP